MSNKQTIVLPPGKYWFFGLPKNSTNEEVKKFEENFIHKLPIDDVYRWGWRVGDTLETAGGVFTFEIVDPRKFATTLFWNRDVKGIAETFTNIDHKGITESEKSETTRKVVLVNKKTVCNNSCIFYWACDGERESPVNPSNSLGLPCEIYCYNDNNIKIE